MKSKKKKRYLFLGLFFSVGIIVSLSMSDTFMTIFYLFLAILFFYLWKNSETIESTEPNNTDTMIENEPVSQLNNSIKSGKKTNTTSTQSKNSQCIMTCLKGFLYFILSPWYWLYGVIWFIFKRKKFANNPEIQKRKTKKCAILTALSLVMFISAMNAPTNEPAETIPVGSKPEISVENAIHDEEIKTLPQELIAEEDISVKDTIDDMTIHFLDVGQGLSILVECSDEYLIYDGGGRDTSSYVVAYLEEQGVTNLKYVISSHYDEDHLAGLIGCLNVFNIENVIGADYVPDTDLYSSFISKVDSLELDIQHPAPGTIYNLGTASATILSPNSFSDSESNNNSIAIKITNGENSFLFTGDAEYSTEYDMIDSDIDLKCDVLCVGHHGSADSTSQKFLTAVQATYAVISCGENNTYSHPDAGTLNRLKSTVAELFRTDKQGTIIAKSDGTQISWNVSPCNDFSPGKSSQEDIYVSLIDNTADSSTDSVVSKSAVSEQSSVESPITDTPTQPTDSEQTSVESPITDTPAQSTDSEQTSVESPVTDTPAQSTDSQTANNNSNKDNNFDKYDTPEQQNTTMSWVLNTNSKKIHYPSCKSVAKIAPHNYSTSNETLDTLKAQGYDTCGNCFK